MLSLDNLLSSLRAAGTKGCRDRNLFSWAVVGSTINSDELGVWDLSDCGMLGNE